MKILGIRTISGPNVWNHRPVLIMTLDLEELTEVASSDLPGLVERLSCLLPGLGKHKCSPGYEGGFIERLHRGTYFGHIVEHIALELSELAGIGVKYGKTVYGGREGVYQVVVRYSSEAGMKYLLESAVDLATAVVKKRAFPLEEAIHQARNIIADNQPGPSTLALIQAAERRNIPWAPLNDHLIQLGYGKHRRLIQATTTSLTSDIGVQIAQDKDCCKQLLREAGIPVPRGEKVYSVQEALKAFEDMKTSVALKPFDGHHGKGVCLNISSKEEVIKAFEVASTFSSAVLIEEYFQGEDFRILVVDGKMVAASRRLPAHVVGDGIHTINELVALENRNPLRGEGHGRPMTLLEIDSGTEDLLARQKVKLEQIPAPGTRIFLKETANLSTGGSAEDVTDEVHPDIRLMCERAARLVGLDVCGIDLILQDIRSSWCHQQGGIIEVNAGPGIRMHHYPSKGKIRDAGEAIVNYMFPDHQGRIPIIAITGTNGKTTVTRMISHILQNTGHRTGTTTTDGIYLNDELITSGDTTGPISARVILNDPGVDIAVLETARGGIIKRGLGFDWCDVGIITNLEADHIGQDGIEDVEDILRIKSLVVERVREKGTIILNADSPILMRLIEEKRLKNHEREIVLFSLNGDSPVIQTHLDLGGRAYFTREGGIFEAIGNREYFLMRCEEIPCTVGGSAKYNIANCLAAIAAANAVGVDMLEIINSLQTFHHEANPGRANLYQIKQGYVLVDYGHNPDALAAIAEMVSSWQVNGITAVLGVPGDRSDEMIRMSGEVAGERFSRIIIREDEDLRERPPGENARLLQEGVASVSKPCEWEIVLNPEEAFERALARMNENDLIIYFYEDRDMIMRLLQRHNARAVHDYSKIIPLTKWENEQEVAWQ